MQRMISLPLSVHASEFAPVDEVTASGPYTVVIHLKTRFTPLTAVLATFAGVVLSPTQLTKLGADFGTDPVCVGPFMFDDRVVGDSVTVVKSPWYYDRKRVYLDKIVFKTLPDSAAAAAALKAGDIQVLDNVSPTELRGVEQTSGLRTFPAKGLGWRGIVINIGNRSGCCNQLGNSYQNVGTPLASSAVLRQAFEEAIDRDALNRIVFNGTTQPGCTPVSPSSASFDASIRCTPYDPAHARKLVAQSGFPNPTVHLAVTATPENVLFAQFLQEEERQVGINVVIDQVASLTPLQETGTFETMLAGPGTGANTDGNFFEWFATSGSRNAGGYSNPRLDAILANSRKATSPKALATLYHAAQQILANDRPAIFLFHSVRYTGVAAGVTGVEERSADLLLRVAFAQLG
jgi:peptide/nickel transport system substrate-binding protein